MLIDTHCHLTDPKLNGQVDEVLIRARKVGVEKVIVPGTDLKDIYFVKDLTEKYENVYGLAGVYPGNVEKIADLSEAIEKIDQMTNNSKILGIGEIGLDCYWNERDIEKQKVFFKSHLELAVRKKIPVAIHSRRSEREIREVFEEMEELPTGQFHCFGESPEFLDYVLDKGFYVSFCGNITYKSASNLRDLVKKAPLNRLLLETDSPYLPPEDKRGGVNEPANVRILAEYIANLLNLPIETLINQTTKNAECLYFHG